MRHILITGNVSESVDSIPKRDYEVWGMNDSIYTWNARIPDPVRIYQVHGRDESTFKRKWKPTWRRDYALTKAVVVVREPDPKIKNNQRRFDFHRAETELGREWFTSTLSYMMCEAYWEHVDSVSFLGVVMDTEEYHIMLPGLIRGIDLMESAGTKVHCARKGKWRIDAGLSKDKEQCAMGYAWPKKTCVDISVKKKTSQPD